MRPVSWFLLFSMVLPAAAADGAFRARTANPVLGFAYDAGAAAIRPIEGIPGAALVGDPIDIGFPIALAAVAPLHDLALAVSSEDGLVRLVSALEARPRAVVLGGAMASPDRILFSPSGTAAVLYSSTGGQAQVVSGIPGQPAIGDLPAEAAPGPMAVADDGSAVLVATGDGLEMQFTGGGAPPVPLGIAAAAGAFRRGTAEALAATASGDIYDFDSGSGQWRQVYAGAGGAGRPVGVQFSEDGTMAYMAGASGTITVVKVATGESSTMACTCTPTSLEALLPVSAFGLTSVSSPLLWVVDASQAAPRIWFVPRRNSQ